VCCGVKCYGNKVILDDGGRDSYGACYRNWHFRFDEQLLTAVFWPTGRSSNLNSLFIRGLAAKPPLFGAFEAANSG
jgi:hypothetical protein